MTGLERTRNADGVEVVRLNRPDSRNAMDTATLDELLATLAELAADADLRVVVFSTTSTRALCAGADVAEQLDRDGGIARMERFARMYQAVVDLPVPTIAVCVGNVVGAGAELAAACDLRVAGDNLKLAWAGAKLGVPVGPARLVPLVGLARAKELIYSGRVVGAEEAARIGLAERVAPEAEAEAAALELAATLAARPAEGLRRLKRMFRDGEDLAGRTARENVTLLDWQRYGQGLPQGGAPTRD
ncbi:Enoyl-CoA hydratase [Patulibacter medicamentivorans]|jgi:enoyl-CoA hydratase/carnithine racemase|uniref:Enoyl-CoA hydratase n=1 Tax=Patulibacter medicamentivorans TaxID=1097667 RepID=H0E8U9_9ACTN|nr:enoyl-CoA hydratase/isomerase family protein [Patulibacter medicamentivorans]EHN09904.1 Enoyl-CoA hydratase [Patulibacter medicamentivorans]